MNGFQEQFGRREDVVATRYDDGDTVTFVADFDGDAAVDVVDGTAIVVVGDEQFEFDLPAGDTNARANNGIVTVEVHA
ncbi:hypothetical protein [Halosegnis sp.]|uniref:hypothetical protein n=1 Tax=Halosegnis sp. TaxID=2864959 RepID=UPI0035D45A92